MKFVTLCVLFLAISVKIARTENVMETIMQQKAEEYRRDKSKPVEIPPNNSIFDFIIVGGGSAGCVLANRLSENSNWNIILIEAGGNENILHDMPAMVGSLPATESDWKYKSIPQENACFGMRDQKCALPRGKVLGGSSSTNYMFYIRGNRHDYDRWAARGNPGWSYSEVFPFFLRSEMANLKGLEQSPWHNRSGEQSVEDVPFKSDIGRAFVSGAQQAGHKYVDYNGYSQLGVSFMQSTTRRGHRASASKSFIYPILKQRRNLKVLTFTRVTRILIEPNTLSAYGVEFVHEREVFTVRARKEVILSAGAFNTPQLLMLSGIGPTENLNQIGIPQLLRLPVGKLLHDHMAHFSPVFTTNTTGQAFLPTSITQKTLEEYQSGNPSTRLSSPAGMESLAFIKIPNSQEPADRPDVEIIMGALSLASDGGMGFKEDANFRDDIYEKVFKELETKDHFTLFPVHLNPKSTGSIGLRDRNPFSHPVIDPNYLSEQDDVEVLLEGIKEAIRITKTPAMQKINATLWERNVPGCEDYKFGTDNYWRCSIRVLSFNMYHYLGTCRMGPDSDEFAVVNSQLKVRGIRRLRLVDMSVMPVLPAAHTNGPALMIAEKGANLIKREWETTTPIGVIY